MNGIGFFGGTFNPVHKGHIALSSWLRESFGLREVWLSLSPQNPLKDSRHLGATDAQRFEMLQLACEGIPGLKAWAGELDMPRPSYTIDVLNSLADLKPTLIIGSDNWLLFPRWHKYKEILEKFSVIIYPRPGYDVNELLPSNVAFAKEAPMMDISSTQIRTDISNNLNQLPPKVADYIIKHNLYGYTKADK